DGKGGHAVMLGHREERTKGCGPRRFVVEPESTRLPALAREIEADELVLSPRSDRSRAAFLRIFAGFQERRGASVFAIFYYLRGPGSI
ncbi:MAG TPA: hypothetical protein VNM90_10550, partial [Haliangium sp.]|nr:hypothetical protein [Haliangium sp.]